jgi:hypothetical protein
MKKDDALTRGRCLHKTEKCGNFTAAYFQPYSAQRRAYLYRQDDPPLDPAGLITRRSHDQNVILLLFWHFLFILFIFKIRHLLYYTVTSLISKWKEVVGNGQIRRSEKESEFADEVKKPQEPDSGCDPNSVSYRENSNT